MKYLFMFMILIYSRNVFSQITYTYVEPNSAIEREKNEKEAFFQQRTDAAFVRLQNCTKQCGRYAADANNPKDPCTLPGATPACLCACNKKYDDSIRAIKQQENSWRLDIARREQNYQNQQKKSANKAQSINDVFNEVNQNVPSNASTSQNKIQQLLAEQQQRYQQTQIDFSNAQTSADNAYQAAIASGKKESGAMLDATLAASQQFSDPNAQLGTLGVGLAASLFMHWGEKKQERLEIEASIKREEERKLAIINSKEKYIGDAININKYGFTDLISKQRYAALFITPKSNKSEEQNIYFTAPILIPKYADDTYPLKDEIEKKLLKLLSLSKEALAEMKINILYPIIEIEKFQSEFTNKMGSGHLIYFSAKLVNFNGYPFSNDNIQTKETNFWNN